MERESMDTITSQFESHTIHHAIKDNNSLLIEIESLSDLDSTAIVYLQRIKQVNKTLESALSKSDPYLIPIGPLNVLQSYLTQQQSYLSAFKSNLQTQNIVEASNQCENILTQLVYIHHPRTIDDIDGIRESVTSFRKAVGQYNRNLEDNYQTLLASFAELKRKADELSAEITANKARTDLVISQYQEQFSAAENSRREQFSTIEKERTDEYVKLKKLFDELELKIKSDSKEIEEAREKQFDAYLNGMTEANDEYSSEKEKVLSQIEEQYKENSEQFKKHLEENAAAVLLKLNDKLKEAQDIVHVIGNTGMVGGYQTVANEEKESAQKWNKIAMGSMVGLIAFAIAAFCLTFNDGLHWGHISSRIFVAVTFGVLLAYAAKQAEKHREIERRNRRTELELASINPFISELPEDIRQEIKRELANRMFGKTDVKLDSNDGSLQITPDLLKASMENVKMVVEAFMKK
jgi:hypothetical protein